MNVQGLPWPFAVHASDQVRDLGLGEGLAVASGWVATAGVLRPQSMDSPFAACTKSMIGLIGPVEVDPLQYEMYIYICGIYAAA